ncbi:hypothetical protein B0H34DRAFT_730520 [Crassisporium funariophilum]|nr:hypothetical protein B0H34DRAFT_730520 [Crassisporium funariophilum]
MAPREPTRAQLSSKLAYQQNTPNFLLKLKNRMNGIPDDEEEDEEFEDDGSGRPPIPRRPAIPERPQEDLGSADEDDGDEKPLVVVLKAGKHLTEREAENVRRAEKGLPPLPEPKLVEQTADSGKDVGTPKESSATGQKSGTQGLSFSSSSKSTFKTNKRKAVGQLDELKDNLKVTEPKEKTKNSKSSAKKAKKTSKTLLSFGDDT